MKKILLLVALSLFVVGGVNAQFVLSAEFRTRGEIDNGTFKPRPDSLGAFNYVSQRSRINLNYNNEKYELRFSLQDVRVWGDGDIYSGTGVFASSNSLNVYEAWFKLKFGTKAFLKIGRQELKFDDQRLLSWRNWNQFALSYDALTYQYAHQGLTLNAGASYNNMASRKTGGPDYYGDLYNENNLIKTLSFVRVSKKFNEHISAAAMITGGGYQKTDDPRIIYLTGTYGLWAKLNYGGFDAKINAYYQNGKGQSGKEVSAYMLTVDPGYNIGTLRFGMGLDYISGDDAQSDDYLKKEKTFNKMYGAVFAYYGWMNYFTYMKSSTANGGLVDIYPNVQFGFDKKHKIRGYFHLFSLANKVSIQSEILDDQTLGSEMDLMYIYKHSKELSLQAGFSYYFTTTTLEKIKKVQGTDISSPYWAWIMITFKPTLFTSK